MKIVVNLYCLSNGGSGISEQAVSVDSLSTSGNSRSEEVVSLYCWSTSGSSISQWVVSVDSLST